MDQLEEYIASNLQRGYSKEQIVQYLITQGYDEKTVRKIADKVSPSSSQNVNPQLKQYIDTNLQQGYTEDQIETALVNQGYNKSEVDSIFESEKKKSPIIPIIITIMIIILLGGGGFYAYQNLLNPELEVNLNLETINSKYFPGETLNFKLTGNSNRDVSVNIQFELKTSSYQLIDRISIEKILGESIDVSESIDLPERITKGTYILDAKFSAEGQTFQTTTNVIVDEEVIEDEPQVTDEPEPIADIPYIPPTRPTTTPEVNQPEVSNVNTKNMGDEDLFYGAQEQTNKADATGYCDKITNSILRTECLSELAKRFVDGDICQIVSVDQRDYCYVGLISEGHGEYCSLVQFESSINMCEVYYNYQRAEECFEGNCESIDDLTEETGSGDSNDINNYDFNAFVS